VDLHAAEGDGAGRRGRGRPDEELREQRNKVQAVLDSIAEGVFTVDREGRITSLNRTAERILGCAAEAVIGRPVRDCLPAEICGQDSPIRESLRTGRPIRNREVTIAAPRGAERSVRAGGHRTALWRKMRRLKITAPES